MNYDKLIYRKTTQPEIVLTVDFGGIGELTQKLYDELTGIQWGKRPDTRGWRVTV